MNYLMCFNHEYPLACIEEKREFKKNSRGRVNELEITCLCLECGMKVTYSLKVKGYFNPKQQVG